jgi:hypothetical protein
MKLLVALAALCVAGAACARPVIVKESSFINFTTIGGYTLHGPAAIDGDDAIVVGSRSEPVDEYFDTYYAAFLFHRSGNTWTLVRKIAEDFDSGLDDVHGHVAVAMKDGIAGLSMDPAIFVRQPSGDWLPGQIGSGNSGTDPIDDISIDGGRIFFGSVSFGGVVMARDSAGVWRGTPLYGDYSGDNDNSSGDAVDINGSWAAVASPYNIEDLPAPALTLFRDFGAPTGWQQTQRAVPAPGHSFGDMAIRGADLFIEDFADLGFSQYRLDDSGQWTPFRQVRSIGDLVSASNQFYGGQIQTSVNFIFHRVWDFDRNAAVVKAFRSDDSSSYHLATLVDSRGGSLGAMQVSGSRLIASAQGRALVFDLAQTYENKSMQQDTFEDAATSLRGWSYLPGSQWSITRGGNSQVFRQSSTVGDAGARFIYTNWNNQAIQTDVTPTAFNGADRWVGLATRRADDSNYYYVTLRSSGLVQLKVMKNGVFATLASATHPVSLNKTYRLRLESFGRLHRVYIDGVAVLTANDSQLISGYPALLTHRAAADFDNVIVSPSPAATIYAVDSGLNYSPPEAGAQPAPWTYSGTGQWYWTADSAPNLVFRQTSTAGDARAAVSPGNPIIGDQIVEARVRIGAFGTGTGEKWAGVMARYGDAANFTYVSLRSSNRVSLRRVQNGQITEIGSIPMTVTPGVWYRLRLDVVAQQLRAYVDGKLLIEAREQSYYSQGAGGVVTYRTAADFDDYREIEP